VQARLLNAHNSFRLLAILPLLVLTLACRSENVHAGAAPPPPPVSVVQVGQQSVPIYREYVGQTFARDMVEVRGRVDGYLEKRLFEAGSDVKAGQVLYTLDVRPYEAEVQKAKGDLAESEASLSFAKKQVALLQAEADLAQAEANLLKARQDVDRLRPLVAQDAASRQDLDNALAALKANEANVRARQAAVEQTRLSTRTQIETAEAQIEANRGALRTAELNLEYATIRSPIDGRIGDSLIQVGGLVTRSSAQPLTTVVPLDPIWVRFKVSEAEQIAYQRRAAGGNAPAQLILGDGPAAPTFAGRIQNTVNQVDLKTGTLEVQATFPNPKHTILPGQFGRVRIQVEDRQNVILVPQKAVQELQGIQSVFVVDQDNKVLVRSITTSDRVGESWVVEEGLKPGDRVIVEGLQKAQPGAIVSPKAYIARK
jgi:membrane fusion protein, multidrug efflux system